jgi:hypothetical protein
MKQNKVVDFIKNHLKEKETGQVELKISEIEAGTNLPGITSNFLKEIAEILEEDGIFTNVSDFNLIRKSTRIRFFLKLPENSEDINKEHLISVPDNLFLQLFDFGTKENYEKFQAYMDTNGLIALFLLPAKENFLSDLINRILIREVELSNINKGKTDTVKINYLNFENTGSSDFEELNIFSEEALTGMIMAEKVSEIVQSDSVNKLFEEANAISLGPMAKRMIFVFHCPSIEKMKSRGRYQNFTRITSWLSKYFNASFFLKGKYKSESTIPPDVRKNVLDHFRLLNETPFLNVKSGLSLFEAYEEMQRVRKNAQTTLYLDANPMEMALLDPSESYDFNYMILFALRTLTDKPYEFKISELLTYFYHDFLEEKKSPWEVHVKNKIGVVVEQLNNISSWKTNIFGLNSTVAKVLKDSSGFFKDIEELWQVLPGFEYSRNYNFHRKREQIYLYFARLNNSKCRIRFFVPDYENCRLVPVNMKNTYGFEKEFAETDNLYFEKSGSTRKKGKSDNKEDSAGGTVNGFAKVAGYREEIAFFEKIIKLQKRKIGSGINGILMFGLPGCGKTYLARAFAEESERTFYYISPSDIVSKWIGESQQNLKNLFTEAKKHAPSIIFIDEIDSIGFSRREEQAHTEQKSTINQLLIEINDLPKDSEVLVIAATNNISRLDAALIRSGRFDIKMAVSPPSEEERRELFSFYLRQLKKEFNTMQLNCFEPRPEDLDLLASASFHFTPADIETVIKKFRLNLLTDEKPVIGIVELLEMVEGLRKSGFLTLTENEVKKFLEECRKFGLKQDKTDLLAKEWSVASSPVGFRTK